MHKADNTTSIKSRLMELQNLRSFELKTLYADICGTHGGDSEAAYIKAAIVEKEYLRRQIGLYGSYMLLGNVAFAARALENVALEADRINENWQQKIAA